MSIELINAFLEKLSKIASFDVSDEMVEATKKFVSDIKKGEKKKEEKKEKKSSPKKDPNAPKKPTNAYILFAKEERQAIKEDSGIEDSKDLIIEIARRWNEEKTKESKMFKKYAEMLEEAKKTYAEEMEDYVAPPVEEEEKKKKKASPKKDPNAPKKPTNAYMIYAKEERANIKKDSGIEESKKLMTEIGRRWKVEKEKESKIFKKYSKLLEEAKEKYAEEMEEYVAPEGEKEEEDKEEKKKAKASSPKKDNSVPKKPTNAYMIYAKEERANIKKDSGIEEPKKLMKEIGSRWKVEKEKNSEIYQKYSKMLEDAKKKYEDLKEDEVPPPSDEEVPPPSDEEVSLPEDEVSLPEDEEDVPPPPKTSPKKTKVAEKPKTAEKPKSAEKPKKAKK
jgi:HMG (high mobility group) box